VKSAASIVAGDSLKPEIENQASALDPSPLAKKRQVAQLVGADLVIQVSSTTRTARDVREDMS
jgi:hypothetical protein